MGKHKEKFIFFILYVKIISMKKISDIEKSIFERYVAITGDQLLLKENAKKHIDPSLKELIDAISGVKDSGSKILAKKAAIEKRVDEYFKDDSTFILFEQIKDELDKRINFLLDKINFFLFEHKKDDIKKIVQSDFKEYFEKKCKTVDNKVVYEYIDKIIERKFYDLFLNKGIRYKSLLYSYLNKMLKEVENFFITNSRDKLEKMSMFQKKNLIHFFLLSLYKKYLDQDKDSGVLNREEYDFLKEKIRLFVVFKYEKALKGD